MYCICHRIVGVVHFDALQDHDEKKLSISKLFLDKNSELNQLIEKGEFEKLFVNPTWIILKEFARGCKSLRGEEFEEILKE